MRAAPLALCVSLAACTQFPQLDQTLTPALEQAAYPTLQPIEPLLAATPPVVIDRGATTDSVRARVQSLRARAAALKARPIVDAATRARMRAATG